MNRYPPKQVREQLRKEVNLGCPVQDCGRPYLQYHHFDPPWNVTHHHNPEGMIALCKFCHPEADNHAWTDKQLREMKKKPYVKNELIGRFNWLRQDIIVMAGAVVHNPQVILKILNEKVIWLEKHSDGYYRLNMVIRDSVGKIILKILNNDWIVYNEHIIDVVCPPSGKELSLTSKDNKTNLAIRFDDVSISEFKERLVSIAENMVREADKANVEWQAESLKRLKRHLARDYPFLPEETKKQIIAQHKAIPASYDKRAMEETFVHRIINKLGNVERVTTCTLDASLDYHGHKLEIKEGIFSSSRIGMVGAFFSGVGSVYSLDENGSSLGGNVQ